MKKLRFDRPRGRRPTLPADDNKAPTFTFRKDQTYCQNMYEEDQEVITRGCMALRLWPDKPPGAICCTLGLPSASLGRPTRLALGKPREE